MERNHDEKKKKVNRLKALSLFTRKIISQLKNNNSRKPHENENLIYTPAKKKKKKKKKKKPTAERRINCSQMLDPYDNHDSIVISLNHLSCLNRLDFLLRLLTKNFLYIFVYICLDLHMLLILWK